ncbi:MAG: hypothetical protein M3237_23030 [Actinomycetota bacterium]|nr:hypothetical protein [Actinomycetota bacterium]
MTHLDDGADLRALMDRSVCDLDAPDHCGPAAVASGRRIRRRRRAMGAVSGVAACAVVTAVFAIPALGDGGGSTPGPPAASDPGAPTPSPPDPMTPSEGPNVVPSTDGPAGWWDMPSTQMVDVLESTVPQGVTVTRADTTTEGPDGPSPAAGGLSGTLDASTGPGAFQIILWQPDLAPIPDPVTTTDAAGIEHTTVFADAASLHGRIQCRAAYDSCAQIRDDSGEVVGRRSTDSHGGTTYHEVALLGPDGGGLYFYVADATGEKPGYEAPTAEAPPLTLAQLRTLAEDPAWTSYRP